MMCKVIICECILTILILAHILYGIREIIKNIKNINEYKKKLKNFRF